MSNESRKKTDNNSESDLELETKQPNKSRRSFAKAGIMAPVMLSLANRPAWGSNVRCTVSGFGSLTAIGSGVMPSETGGCDYDSTDTIFIDQCSTGGVNDTLISVIFGCAPQRDMTVCEALGSSRWRWNKLMVSAYFNEQKGKNPFGSTTFSPSVSEVFCAIDDSPGAVYGFGGVMMDKVEIMDFLAAVLNMTVSTGTVIFTDSQSSSSSRQR